VNIRSDQCHPQYDRCLIRPVFEETSRGLVVPQLAKDKAAFFLADVVSVGHGRVTENNDIVPLRVKVGDRVMVERKAGMPLSLEDGHFLMISEMHVLAVVDKVEESRIVVVA
jgi:chaperonin GroES